MLHKIIALDSFEEPSWHTTTVSGFPDSGFSSGETAADARLCEPQIPLPLQGPDWWARLWHSRFWALKQTLEPCPCFKADAAARNCLRAMLRARGGGQQGASIAGCFEGYVWSKILPVLGDGHIHLLGACSSGERLEELIWHERATECPGTLEPACPGPVLNIRLSSHSCSFTFHLWICDFTKALGIQEGFWSRPQGKVRRRNTPALNPHWALGRDMESFEVNKLCTQGGSIIPEWGNYGGGRVVILVLCA